ncbi:MAG TPA: hypothetical protein ENF33_00800 [Nitrososphaeria archaeon]|nr:hypothetical protein [Nitrososphaeria archaeon]
MINQGDFDESLFDEKAREKLKLKLEQSLNQLSAQIIKLRSKYGEMVARSKEYFEEVVQALMNGDENRASIYAEEIAEIRRLAGIVIKTQLVLEQVKLRLETILEISDVLGLLIPLISLVAEVEDEVRGVAPEAAESLRELASCIEDFTSISGAGEEVIQVPKELDAEALKILEEAQKKAAERVKSAFPDVPKLSEEEKLVYSYISASDEELDLKRCARELGLDEDQIRDVLRRLEQKGLIQLVG